MSVKNDKNSRKRAKNYTNEEEVLLVELVDAYKNVLDAVIWRQKEEAWRKIEEEFSATSGTYRHWKTLRDKYEVIKRRSKTEIASQKLETYRTGGGVSSTKVSTVSAKIAAMLGDSATGLVNVHDSDCVIDDDGDGYKLLETSIEKVEEGKLVSNEDLGKIIRYSIWTLCGLLIVVLIRFSFLPGSGHAYKRFFMPTLSDLVGGIASIPIYGLSAFGPGWGLFVVLSSFNKFKTNIMKQSWIIGIGQMGIIIGLDLLAHLTEIYFGEVTQGNYYTELEQVWTLYLSCGSAMSHMALANFWSIIFYFMLFLAGMLLIIIQLYTILTTIFDEFVALRERKMEICMSLIAVTAAISLYFTSNHGVTYFTALSTDTCITQTAINLLLLLIVLWIYGRVRFQRDIEFMIDERFSTWKINILRFVAPLGMLLALAISIEISIWEHYFSNFFIDTYAILLIGLPWLLIPGYAIYCMFKTMGSIKTRFFRCCHPTDWYPMEAEYRQQYDKCVGNADITQTLNDVKDDEMVGIFVAYYEHMISHSVIAIFAVIFIVIPWFFIPGYAAYFMWKNIGSFKMRFQRCCRPNDWYPVDPDDRQRYEEAMGNMDITHQLKEISDNVL